MEYKEFLEGKDTIKEKPQIIVKDSDINPMLYDFQKELVRWSLKKGRSAIFADCGLGKTPIYLAWADIISKRKNKPVLIITPLAVSHQTVREGEKFGVECVRSNNGEIKGNIIVTNYERLHYFDRRKFVGVVCDESSAIKHFTGKRQKEVTEFMLKTPYRLLCTATAAPNDYIELGTAAEALGVMGRMDMLGTFFKNDENSLHPIWWGARWRFRAHAEDMFWKWVCSWAKAIRKPSDMGYKDDRFILPPLTVNETVVNASRPLEGRLFVDQALGIDDQRRERKHTMNERCETVAEKVNTNGVAVVWCHLNQEADLLEKLIPDAVQVKGGDTDEKKENTFMDFVKGDLRVLITKPKIGAFGLNWQHCSHMTFFPSHSFEQYYQGVRRCWRFGQKREVVVDIVTTEGELGVLKNLKRKELAADKMFDQLISKMNHGMAIKQQENTREGIKVPTWL